MIYTKFVLCSIYFLTLFKLVLSLLYCSLLFGDNETMKSKFYDGGSVTTILWLHDFLFPNWNLYFYEKCKKTFNSTTLLFQFFKMWLWTVIIVFGPKLISSYLNTKCFYTTNPFATGGTLTYRTLFLIIEIKTV